MVIFDPVLLQCFEDPCDAKVYYVDHGSSVDVSPMDGDGRADFLRGRDAKRSKHIRLDVVGSV
jgi:hypothetical protein